MDYLASLRKHVGHAPLLMVGAAVLSLDEKNRLLLLKRSDNGCWGLPGGAVELGEDVEAAARRELFEETGLQSGEISLFGVFSGAEMFYVYPNGDQVHNVTVVFLARQMRGSISMNNEHTDWMWFATGDLPANISPPIQPVIKHFINFHDQD